MHFGTLNRPAATSPEIRRGDTSKRGAPAVFKAVIEAVSEAVSD
jgi:cobalamin biosynthesis protein CobD/CbiB